MPYINVHVSPTLDLAITKAALAGGKEWTRSKWLRRLAQRELANHAGKALLEVITRDKTAKKGSK